MGIFKPDKNGIICIPSLGNSDIEKLTDDLMKKNSVMFDTVTMASH